jgi:hypothetical protein
VQRPKRWLRRARRLLLVASLGLGAGLCASPSGPATVWAEDDVAHLERQLISADDFKLRVHAALELGRQRSRGSRIALERALKDQSAAVRAASAAALKTLADPRSREALVAAQNDSSDAVQNQVAAAIRALDAAASVAYVVGLGEVEGDSTAAGKSLQKVARRRLSRLPSVKVKGDADPTSTLPELLLDARISRLKEKRSNSGVEISAKVDFVLSRMPGREIKGRLTGAATVRGSVHARPRELEQLKMEAVEAATDSALDNVERVLRAAVE